MRRPVRRLRRPLLQRLRDRHPHPHRPLRRLRDDELNNVYVVPSCVVDCTRNVVVNGAWTLCSARGIGINNNGRSCSIRMNESGFGRGVGALANGRAYTCNDNTACRVSLAFR